MIQIFPDCPYLRPNVNQKNLRDVMYGLWFLCRACLYVLGLISKTKQGCDTLKQQGWDAVKHNRNMRWPVVPEEVEPQTKPYNLLPSAPSTLSLTESINSRHNSESDSVQPGKPNFSNEVIE